MRDVFAVFRKEMKVYLVSPIPYLLAAVFTAFATYQVFENAYFLLLRQANLDGFFNALPLMLILVVPALAMRLWSEELRGGTFETLLTFPVRTRHLVLGKWLAAWVVIAFCLAATSGLAITAATLGDLDGGPAVGGYLGAWLMGGAFLAAGLWMSSLTGNQIVAFLLTAVVCLAFTLVEGLAEKVEAGAFTAFLERISITSHFRAIGRGVVDLRDIAYFVSFIAFFLYLNVETVENRRCA